MIVSGKDFREIDYSGFKVCLIDPPWDYNDKNPAVQKEQVTYSRWDNRGGLSFLFSQEFEYIFIWTTNSMLEDVFNSPYKEKGYEYKQIVTWLKKTPGGKIAFGLGNNFRNCTEQLLVFVKKKSKPLRLNIRNFIEAPSGKRTSKPKAFEKEIIGLLEDRGFKDQICYIFSGPSSELEGTSIFAIDKIFENGE